MLPRTRRLPRPGTCPVRLLGSAAPGQQSRVEQVRHVQHAARGGEVGSDGVGKGVIAEEVHGGGGQPVGAIGDPR